LKRYRNTADFVAKLIFAIERSPVNSVLMQQQQQQPAGDPIDRSIIDY